MGRGETGSSLSSGDVGVGGGGRSISLLVISNYFHRRAMGESGVGGVRKGGREWGGQRDRAAAECSWKLSLAADRGGLMVGRFSDGMGEGEGGAME